MDLSDLLRYKNTTVIKYFCHHYPEYTREKAEVLFTDLLGWLWLNQKRARDGKETKLFGPLLTLDHIWHTFILHTKDYVDFSNQYFGTYFHHNVEPVGFEYSITEEELRDYLEDCFSYLGSEWVERRFLNP